MYYFYPYNTILIDDLEENVKSNPNNSILIKPFYVNKRENTRGIRNISSRPQGSDNFPIKNDSPEEDIELLNMIYFMKHIK